MTIRSILTAGTAVAVILLVCGCSGGGQNPVTPDGGFRFGDDFRPPWNIFGLNQEDDPGNPNYQHRLSQEVDLAPLVWGHLFAGDGIAGDLVTDDPEDHHGEGNSFVAAVSRVDNMLAGQVLGSVIELKFFAMRQHPLSGETVPVMYDLQGGEFWGSDPAVGYRFNRIPGYLVSVPTPAEQFCQSPRVIARADSWNYGNLLIDVCVAYEVRNDPVTISVYNGRFLIDFTPSEPGLGISIVPSVPQGHTEVASGEGYDYLFPDLEFGPTSGWTHLVYTAYQQGSPMGSDARIHYRARETVFGDFSGYVWINEFDRAPNEWEEDPGGRGGWIPRIDVGTVTDPHHFATEGDVMTVAVVYTRQQVNPLHTWYGYRSYVRYWREDLGPIPVVPPGTPPEDWVDSHQMPVINGEWEGATAGAYHGSGLPVIDIAPETNTDHDAYVAFVQQVSVLPNPIRHSVYMVGYAIQGSEPVTEFYRISQEDDTAVLPAICVHYGIRQLSITYYYQASVGAGPWTVIANRIEYFGGSVVHQDTEIDAEAHGNFNIAELQNFNFGVASGLAATVTEGEPSFFAAWSDSVGIVCEPCHVQATFGHTYVPE